MTRVNFFSLLLIISAIMFLPVTTKAQVTIGSAYDPQPFSVLELISNNERGFRLPQLSEYQRDNHLTPMLEASERDQTGVSAAMGLQIFNTCNQCVETWNGDDWISLCEGDTPDPCAGLANLPDPVVFCRTPQPTIDSLTTRARSAGGRGTIEWFSAATGGDPLPNNHPLTASRYYAGNCAGAVARTPVTVQLMDCSEIIQNNIRVTTFVNVMYDFQHQTLMSFVTAGGEATEWQWQVSTTSGGTYTDIPGATSANWRVPAGLIHNPALAGLENFTGMVNNELFFKVKMRNPANPEWIEATNANALGILFIPTNTRGFGIDANGVRYLVINREPQTVTPETGNTIRVALLNLGQSGTGAWHNGARIDIGTPLDDSGRLNDAGDLGDFFQWGRIADGHQHIVWSKETTGDIRNNRIIPMDGNGATSAVIARPAAITDLQINIQGQVGNPESADRFITVPDADSADWGAAANPSGRNDLWGLLTTGRGAWTSRAQANNPCPQGWHIPSIHTFADMMSLVAGFWQLNMPVTVTNGNTWSWRNSQAGAGAVGGILVTNRDGEILFLPAAGQRGWSDGALGNLGGTSLNYWSSTHDQANNARSLWTSGTLILLANPPQRAMGLLVRCVSDN